MRVRDFHSLNIEERRKFLKAWFDTEKLKHEVQVFQENGYRGINFLVLRWFRKDRTNIVITAHYDGAGAYDNAGGTVGLMWLLKWAELDNLSSFKDKFGLVVSFTDGEEAGLFGVKRLLRHHIFRNEKNYVHIALDGFGIGTQIGGFGNRKDVTLKFNSIGETNLPLQAETTIFQDKGIPSLHLFTLPEEQLNNLAKKRLFPPCWRIIHTREDTPEKIDEEMLPFVILNLYKKIPNLDFEESKIFIVK